jgi:hypothetical protein
MTYYTIVKDFIALEQTTEWFEEEIEEMIDRGWKLHGSLSITSHNGELLYAQALTRKTKER